MKWMAWTTALGLAVLFFGGWWWWQNQVCCGTANASTNTTAATTTATTLPYYFSRPGAVKMTTTAGFAAWADSTKAAVGLNNRLLITGIRYSNEDTTGVGDLGLQRAEALRSALGPFIPMNQIDVASRNLDAALTDSIYAGNELTVVTAPPTPPTINGDSATSVMADGMLTVYFPSNSVRNIFDAQTEQNISGIIGLAKSSGRSVTITGHTDDQGDSLVNQQLGLARAGKLKKILQGRGLSAQQISVQSMGEAQPIADNSTATGRATNRRVEVRLQQ